MQHSIFVYFLNCSGTRMDYTFLDLPSATALELTLIPVRMGVGRRG